MGDPIGFGAQLSSPFMYSVLYILTLEYPFDLTCVPALLVTGCPLLPFNIAHTFVVSTTRVTRQRAMTAPTLTYLSNLRSSPWRIVDCGIAYAP